MFEYNLVYPFEFYTMILLSPYGPFSQKHDDLSEAGNPILNEEKHFLWAN